MKDNRLCRIFSETLTLMRQYDGLLFSQPDESELEFRKNRLFGLELALEENISLYLNSRFASDLVDQYRSMLRPDKNYDISY
jgi:hypothetical protein